MRNHPASLLVARQPLGTKARGTKDGAGSSPQATTTTMLRKNMMGTPRDGNASLKPQAAPRSNLQALGAIGCSPWCSCFSNRNLQVWGRARTTRAYSWPEHRLNPPLLARPLLAPATGTDDTGSGHHRRPLVGHVTGTVQFSLDFPLSFHHSLNI
jgi:hypothetical protein